MKLKIKLLLTATITTLFFNHSFSQTQRIYAGYVSWSGFEDQLAVLDFDETGLTLIEHRSLSSDAGTVSGCYGLALNPISEDMYILYQLSSGGANDRRLGILDTLSGEITDIGIAGNLTDIAFDTDGTLYGTTGSYSSYNFVEVNLEDASISTLFEHSPSNYGPSIGYDLYHDRIIKMDRDNVTYIDLDTYTETAVGDIIDHPGEIHSIFVTSDSTAIVSNYSDLHSFNMNTKTFTSLAGVFSYGLHAMSATRALVVLSEGPSVFCDNEISTLYTSLDGTDYQWLLDGELIDGATESTYEPTVSGFYSCIVDEKEAVGRSIEVLTSPIVSYTATPNPVYLGEDPTGTVDFTNTTTGGGDTFMWDFDNGFTTTLEDPSFAFAIAGIYNVELIVINSENDCSGSDVQPITVIEGLGIENEIATLFKVYPSPVTENLTIQFSDENASDYSVELMDATGRFITALSLNNSGTIIYNMSTFENGIYFVKVTDKEGNNSFAYRVVKN